MAPMCIGSGIGYSMNHDDSNQRLNNTIIGFSAGVIAVPIFAWFIDPILMRLLFPEQSTKSNTESALRSNKNKFAPNMG
jgi:hypothetical protein